MSVFERLGAVAHAVPGAIYGFCSIGLLTVAVDNDDWTSWIAGGLGGISLLAAATSVKVRSYDEEINGRDGRHRPRDVPDRALVSPPPSTYAVPVDISTTRRVSHAKLEDELSARLGTIVHSSDGPSYLTTVQWNSTEERLANLQRPRADFRTLRDDPGIVVGGEPVDANDVPDEALQPVSLQYRGVRLGRGRGRMALAAFCVGFVVAGSATGVLLPDTSVVGQVVRSIVGGNLSDSEDSVRDALKNLDTVLPGSSKFIRSVDLDTYSSGARITAHDRDKGRDFILDAGSNDPYYLSDPTKIEGTFALTTTSVPPLNAMYTKVAVQVDGDIDRLTIERPGADRDPIVTFGVSGSDTLDAVEGTTDGKLGDVFAAENIDTSYKKLDQMLTQYGLSKTDKVIQKIDLRSTLRDTPTFSAGPIQNTGGLVLEISTVGTDKAQTGDGEMVLVPGLLPTFTSQSFADTPSELRFALADVSIDVLHKVINDAAKRSKAEAADREAMALVIGADYSGEQVIEIQLGENTGSHHRYSLLGEPLD